MVVAAASLVGSLSGVLGGAIVSTAVGRGCWSSVDAE